MPSASARKPPFHVASTADRGDEVFRPFACPLQELEKPGQTGHVRASISSRAVRTAASQCLPGQKQISTAVRLWLRIYGGDASLFETSKPLLKPLVGVARFELTTPASRRRTPYGKSRKIRAFGVLKLPSTPLSVSISLRFRCGSSLFQSPHLAIAIQTSESDCFA